MSRFYGGPYHGDEWSMRTASTLIFTAKGQTGYYRCRQSPYPEYDWLTVQPVLDSTMQAAKDLGYPVAVERVILPTAIVYDDMK